MTQPTFAQWRSISQAANSLVAESLMERILSAFATLASGQNPDGSTFNLVGASTSATAFPWTHDPAVLQSSDITVRAANAAAYNRVQGSGTISNLRTNVSATSGNISVGVYNTTGSGASAAANTRLQTSGAVATPANGAATIALGGSVAVDSTAWFAFSMDNTTAHISQANTLANNALLAGMAGSQLTAHPLPATATMVQADGTVALSFVLMGL